MGTRYSVQVVTRDQTPKTGELQTAIDRRLAQINRQMSTYDSNSELSRFNASSETDQWFEVSNETAHVVMEALRIAERTDGAFDPTVGPAVNLWGFGPGGRRRQLPDEEAIEKTRARIGYRQVTARSQPPGLKKSRPDVFLDLSGVAKGFAVDEIMELLAAAGVESAMVEIGGEVRTLGSKPGGAPWRIGVERPTPQGRKIGQIVELRGSMATSGDYRNFFEADGVRYSHTIDPTTARPVTHGLATVTVCRTDCLEADALATALLVMGPVSGYDWCSVHQIAALFQIHAPDGQIVEKPTAPFRKLAAAGKSEASEESE